MEITTHIAHKAASKQNKSAQAHSADFANILSKTLQPKSPEKIEAQPATLIRSTPPRDHLNLTSLNQVGELHTPKPAALERMGESRILPFVLSSTR